MFRKHNPRVSRRSVAAVRSAIESLENRTLLSSVVVNSTSDTATGTGVVTLRDAINIADSSTDPTTITFDPTVFAAAQTIVLDGTQLELSNTAEPTTISGPTAGVTINGNGDSRGFQVDAGVTASFSDITVANCIDSGIFTTGNLTLTGVTIADNSTPAFGGGIYNGGAMLLTNVTVADNTADDGGGGIQNGGADGSGTQYTDGSATLVNVTVSGNTSESDYAAGLNNGSNFDFTMTIGNTVVADNSFGSGHAGGDVDGVFDSEGFNIIGTTDDVIDGSTGWIASDQTGTEAAPLDADLGALADNGGPTETILPLSGSPALGAGSVALIPAGVTTDQRGLPRTVNGAVDIGAVEVQSDVALLDSSTAIVASAASTVVGGSVTFTATVGGTSSTPTGSVTFLDNGIAIGSQSLVDGAATFSTTSLSLGSNSIIASYGGDSVYASSDSSAVTVHVSQISVTSIATISTLTASANIFKVGNTCTLTCAVASQIAGGPAPTGTITIFEDGTAKNTQTLTDGVAVVTWTANIAGPTSLDFVYSGDASYAASTSNSISQTYLPLSELSANIRRAVIPSANVAGQPLNARVPASFTNTGSVLSGTYAIVLYVDTSTGGLSGNQVALQTVTRRATLKAGRSLALTLAAKKLPAILPAGTYYLLVEVTDPLGNSNLVNTSQTIAVTAPFITLAASLSAVKPTTVAVNRFGSIPITITNNGNLSATGSLIITLLPSIDGISVVPGVTLTTVTRRVTLKAGKSGKYILRFRISAAFAVGYYYPIAAISLDGVSATAIGTSPFTAG